MEKLTHAVYVLAIVFLVFGLYCFNSEINYLQTKVDLVTLEKIENTRWWIEEYKVCQSEVYNLMHTYAK